jgi:hypothetical protein
MSATSDVLTILRTRGLPATKTIGLAADGRPAVVASYSNAKRLPIREAQVVGLEELAQALDLIGCDEFIVRGEPLPGTDHADALRRLHPDPTTGEAATFKEVPRRYVLLDVDGLSGPFGFDPLDGELAAEFARAKLPAGFHRAACWWQLMSSAGIKRGVRIRLAFWLDRPAGQGILERLLAGAPVDGSVFRPVQPVYVAKPILRDGVRDPVPVRSGVLHDTRDVVHVPELLAAAPKLVLPAHSPEGKRYVSDVPASVAQKRLAALCRAVARAARGSRHRTLIWAAARAVELDHALSRSAIAQALFDAARAARLEDSDRDLQRQITNGIRIGAFGTGAVT